MAWRWGDTKLPRVIRVGKEDKGDLPGQGGDYMNGRETGFASQPSGGQGDTSCSPQCLRPTSPLAELPEEQRSSVPPLVPA